ncbi:hypothetical protein B0H13DRAFT_2476612 [Mycena leptocephala]|nr:hypothetical protein B0H13DRAFT_2476612 [Mycena leptocephala]
MALAVLGLGLAIHLGARFIQMLLSPPPRPAPFSHPLPMAPPCLRRSVGFKLSRSPIPPWLWVSWAGMHADFRHHCKSPGSPGGARRDESMDETASVHGGGTKVLSRRTARGGDAFLHFRPRIQRRRAAAVDRCSAGPYLHPHPHRTRLAPRLDPSSSIPPSLTGKNATPPSATPATAHNRDGDGDGAEIDDEEEKAHGALEMRVRMRTSSPARAEASPSPSSSARAGSAVAAILKHGQLWLGAVDGYAPVSRAPLLHAYSTAESSACGALAYQAPSSTAADSGFEPLQYANVRDVDVDIANPAPTAHSVASQGPAYTVGSARSECGDKIRRPSCAPAYGWIRHIALGADAHSRVLLEAKMEVENARGAHDEPRHQNLAKTPPTPEEFLARFRDIDCSAMYHCATLLFMITRMKTKILRDLQSETASAVLRGNVNILSVRLHTNLHPRGALTLQERIVGILAIKIQTMARSYSNAFGRLATYFLK